MAYRFNPAPGWPAPPEGWTPPEGWQPDPAWPPAPEGWQFWVWEDDTPAAPATGESAAADPVVEAPLSRQHPEAEPAAPLGTPEHPEAPFSAYDATTEPRPDQGDGEHLQAPFSGEGPGESDAPPADAAPGETPEQASEQAPGQAPVADPGQGEPHAPFSEQEREAEPPAHPGTREHPQAVFSTDDDAGEEPELGQGMAGQPQDPAEPAPAPTPPPAVFPPGASGTGHESPQPYAEQPADRGWGQPGGQAPDPVDPAPPHQPPQPYAQQGHPAPQHAPQQPGQHHRQSAHPAPQSPPKKGKGMLVALIIVAVILAIAFVWALISFFGNGASANAAATPVLHAIVNAPPTHAG